MTLQNRSNNNNTKQVQAFRDYHTISDETIQALEGFEYFIVNDWDDTFLSSEHIEEVIPVIKRAIAEYLMQDEKSQALIKAGEQELLAKWSK